MPQQIYLSDNTIAANIAFGVNDDEIDQDTVEKGLQKLQIYMNL